MFKCSNCQVKFDSLEDKAYPNISKLTERLLPGDVVPDGECPGCGAFVYSCENRAEKPIVIIRIEDGIVQTVDSNIDIEAILIDIDKDSEDYLITSRPTIIPTSFPQVALATHKLFEKYAPKSEPIVLLQYLVNLLTKSKTSTI